MGRKESPDPRSPWQGFCLPITLFGRGEEETMETSWPGPAARPSANNSKSGASPVVPQALLNPRVCGGTPRAGGLRARWMVDGMLRVGSLPVTRLGEDAQIVVFFPIPTCPSWKRRSVPSCALVCDGMPAEVRRLGEAVAS